MRRRSISLFLASTRNLSCVAVAGMLANEHCDCSLFKHLVSVVNGKVSETQNISNRVSRLREKLQLTQDGFAKAIGFSRNYISMVENGREPGRAFLSALLTLEARIEESEKPSEPGARNSREDIYRVQTEDFESRIREAALDPVFGTERFVEMVVPRMPARSLAHLLSDMMTGNDPHDPERTRIARRIAAAFLDRLAEETQTSDNPERKPA